MPTKDEISEMEFGSSAYVYAADILAKSACLVQENSRWEMPSDCRRLVALLYDYDDKMWTAEHLEVSADALKSAIAKRLSEGDAMKGQAALVEMPSPTTPPRRLKMEKEIRDHNGDRLQLATRLGFGTASVVLLVDKDGTLVFAGDSSLALPLPEVHNYGAILKFEESVLLSSSSFPWHGGIPAGDTSDERIESINAWWKNRRPYDDTIFVLITHDGTFELPNIIGAYDQSDPGIGLTIKKLGKQNADGLSGEEL